MSKSYLVYNRKIKKFIYFFSSPSSSEKMSDVYEVFAHYLIMKKFSDISDFVLYSTTRKCYPKPPPFNACKFVVDAVDVPSAVNSQFITVH